MMGFFGVYPQWDERNRVTWTRSPFSEDLYMLVVFTPTTELELVRFGAGISGTGDIMVPGTVLRSGSFETACCGWVWYNSYKRIGITSLKKTSESRAVNLTFQSFQWYELVVTQFMIHMRISVIFCEPSGYRANVS